MARMARAVLVETPHHVTQRGVGRRPVFFSDADRHVYLELVQHAARQCNLRLLGYCLMPNHVHWVVMPREPRSMAKAFGRAHGRYAQYANAVWCRTGHFWQNRFFSCSLEGSHLWAALRYVERNPVRAGLVATTDAWPWSSAAAHLGRRAVPDWLDTAALCAAFTSQDWRIYVESNELAEVELLLRVNTYSGRPLGSAAFLKTAGAVLGRNLQPKKGGRPRKIESPLVESPCRDTLLVDG